MERKKQNILKRLGELNKIVFVKPTARDLHSSRPLLRRVSRQESQRYKEFVEKQKANLNIDLRRIDSYIARLRMRKEYLARMPLVLDKPETSDMNSTLQQNYLESLRRRERYSLNIPISPVQPDIVVGKKPVLRRTRLQRYRNRRRY